MVEFEAVYLTIVYLDFCLGIVGREQIFDRLTTIMKRNLDVVKYSNGQKNRGRLLVVVYDKTFYPGTIEVNRKI